LTLDKILSSEFDNILEVEPELQVAEASALPDTPSTLAIPCSEPQEEEETLFPDFMLDIEPALFADFGNILNYYSIKKPQNHFLHSRKPSILF
jgi:hypothetical protein